MSDESGTIMTHEEMQKNRHGVVQTLKVKQVCPATFPLLRPQSQYFPQGTAYSHQHSTAFDAAAGQLSNIVVHAEHVQENLLRRKLMISIFSPIKKYIWIIYSVFVGLGTSIQAKSNTLKAKFKF